MTSMFRAIYSLALTPGGRGIGSQLKTFGPISVFYSVAPNGDVKIKLLSINEEPKRFVKNDPGLYQVAWDDSEKAWFPKERLESAMDLNHQWSGAHSAAIVGKFENATQAGERIILHITNAYKSAFNVSEIQQSGKHFSLYWMNNDFDSKQDVESIVSLIQNAQTEKANIRWLIHGEGAGVFVKAMQYIPIANEISAL